MSGSFQTIPNINNIVQTTGNQSIAGVKTFTDSTASTSTTTGALIINNGLGVGGQINANSIVSAGNTYVGSALIANNSASSHNIAGTLSLGSSASTHSFYGSFNFLTASSTHLVSGNLTVSKTFTTAGRKKARRAVSSTSTTTVTDEVIFANATSLSFTITLVSASTAGDGAIQTIFRTDSAALNTLTVTPVVNGGTVGTQSSRTYMSDGTSWYNIY